MDSGPLVYSILVLRVDGGQSEETQGINKNKLLRKQRPSSRKVSHRLRTGNLSERFTNESLTSSDTYLLTRLLIDNFFFTRLLT